MINKCAVIFTCIVLLLYSANTSETEKWCRVRNLQLYPRELWNVITGFFCYNYTNNYRLNFKYNISYPYYNFNNRSYTYPVTLLTNTTYFTYDYEDEESVCYVKESFKTEYFFEMWRDCCRDAADCCDNVMTADNVITTEGCPAVWDGWTCYAPATPGTNVTKVCSKQAYSTDSNVCELYTQKECFANNTWNTQTDDTGCAMAPVLRNRHTFNVIFLAVGCGLSFPAVVIFFSFRTFRQNLRYIMHRNLILVIIIRSLLTIMSKRIIILDALDSSGNNVMAENSVACRVLAFFENAAKNGMFACMLADGFYLHKLIVRPFADEPNLIYIYAAVLSLSFVPSLIWAIVRNAHGGEDCWMVDDTDDQWIIDGFRIAILVINFLLLLDIIRIMVVKLKRGSVSQQARSTLRATMLLIPLFGIHIFIIANRNIVPGNTCTDEDIYYYISYTIEGLQGIMVALLFCYLNSEVRGELKNAFRKVVLSLESRFNIKLYKEKKDLRRRTTAATNVDPYGT